MDNKMNPTEKTKQLVEMILIRDYEYDKHSNAIKTLLDEHLLPILTEFLEVTPNKVDWLTFDMQEGILLIGAMVTHDSDKVPDFLNFLAPVDDDENITSVQRIIKFIIPALLSFAPKETIINYLNEKLKNQIPQTNVPTYYINSKTKKEDDDDKIVPISSSSTPFTFNKQILSPEQQEMLSIFELTQPKTKQ